MSKFLDPKYITAVFTMVAIAINKKLGLNLDEVELGASIAVSVNFIFAQLVVDFQKMKTGEDVKFSKTKFTTMVIACLLIGFTQYIGIELETEDIMWIAGVAMAFISGKGLKDVIEARSKGGTQVAANDDTHDYSKLDVEKHSAV